MSFTQDEIILDDTSLGTDAPHHACCVRDEFLCGAPFHPEMEVSEDDEELCVECDEITVIMICTRGHEHCPLTGGICPK